MTVTRRNALEEREYAPLGQFIELSFPYLGSYCLPSMQISIAFHNRGNAMGRNAYVLRCSSMRSYRAFNTFSFANVTL